MLSPVRNAVYCCRRPRRKRVIARKNNRRVRIEVTVCDVHTIYIYIYSFKGDTNLHTICQY